MPDTTIARISSKVMNIGHFMTQAAARLPDQPALIRGDEVRTWSDVNRRADAIAHALATAGIGKGHRVVLHSNNQLDMAEAMYAVFKTGAVLVPMNFRLAPAEVAAMASAAGCTAMIGNASFPDHIAHVERTLPEVKALITIGGDYEDVVAEHAARGAFPDAAVEYDDPAWFFFTSGTTGFPKMAVLSHGQLGYVITNYVADLLPGLGSDDASLVVAPLSHGAGLHYFVQVARAAPSVLMPSDHLDEAAAWQLIEQHRITNLFTVPTIVKRLVDHPAVDDNDHSKLRHVIYAGAPMYRADQIAALKKLGPVLVQYYGLGEVTGNITILPAEDHHVDDDRMPVGSCGYARTGMQVAILDDDGNELEPGETGNICVCGLGVFAGYMNNTEANDECFINGWFITGDIGHVDERGYLYITGRRSDMYISGGSNVYPREIEEKILTHDAVEEVAIVGVPHRDWGEVGAAVVVRNTNAKFDTDAFNAWLKDNLPRYKQPAHLFFWDEMPKSAYGKVEKKRIKQMLFDQGLVERID